ncbi:hypothetical protein SQ03_10395 [Methylobacterium platani JCM 14648]|uniref:Amidohydrolase-related domain-containing protein n=1 Tax=Methylobacterium platani JCM 14648 TaxID=1295136 RepID=A0ABR5H487_9HYPH|nr:hypothetical protein SQ03_10395 [Methylobacterium platani JCM 14648]
MPHPRPARVRVPDGACDSHIHVFGPQALFPFAQSRGYTPPEAPVEAYRRVQAALGLARAVIVQPSVYGTDNACTFEAARQLGGPERCRIVAVAPPGGPRDPDGWREAGVCGIRINAVAGGGPPIDQIGAAAAAVADLGWHVQLYLPRAALIEAVPTLLTLPTAVVIDHLGDPDPADPTGPALVALQRLLDGGRAWVKLSGGYIASALDAPWPDVAPTARALAATHPDRLVWGTNWPHPVRYRAMPEDGDLLDALAEWLDDEAAFHRVLVENPAHLYGFARR